MSQYCSCTSRGLRSGIERYEPQAKAVHNAQNTYLAAKVGRDRFFTAQTSIILSQQYMAEAASEVKPPLTATVSASHRVSQALPVSRHHPISSSSHVLSVSVALQAILLVAAGPSSPYYPLSSPSCPASSPCRLTVESADSSQCKSSLITSSSLSALSADNSCLASTLHILPSLPCPARRARPPLPPSSFQAARLPPATSLDVFLDDSGRADDSTVSQRNIPGKPGGPKVSVHFRDASRTMLTSYPLPPPLPQLLFTRTSLSLLPWATPSSRGDMTRCR